MASWKKIIVSGSDAELKNLSLTGLAAQNSEATAVVINGSDVIGTRELGSNAFTSTTVGTTSNSLVDGNGITDFTFNGSAGSTVSLELDGSTLSVGSSGVKIADAGVTATQLATGVAGDGLTGGAGTALTVVGGDGITANANDIAVTAEQTTITAVKNASLAVGRDAHNLVDFSTDDQIKFRVGNDNGVIFKASGEMSASLLTVSDIDEVDSINAGSGTNGNLDFTVAGTVNLRASNSTTHGLQLFGGANGAAKPHIGTVTHEFLDFNVGSTDDVIVLAGTTGGGFKAGEARFIGLISGSAVSASGDIYGNKFYGDGSGLTGLTSAANGQLTLSTTGAINGSATFGANDSGNTTFEVSIDNATTSALGAASFASADFAVSSGAVSIKTGGVSNDQLAGSIANAKLAGSITNAKLSNSSITVGGVATSLGGTVSGAHIVAALSSDLGGNFTIGTEASDTARFTGGVVVEGDLTVNGDLTTVNTTNLIVEDKFTTFASGSTSSTDGGIIVQGAASAGQGLGWDSATGRWALDADMALNATALTPDSFIATVTFSTSPGSGAPVYGGTTKGAGSIHVETDTGDIYIYA